MGRSSPGYINLRGIKGINQQEELSDSVMELNDARNFWAPNGKLEKRPGFWGIGRVVPSSMTAQFVLDDVVTLSENASHVFTATKTLNSKPVDTWWYWGWSNAPTLTNYPVGLMYTPTTTNSNLNSVKIEYWNGFQWAPLNAVEVLDSTGLLVTTHIPGQSEIFFPYPNDWALSTLNGSSRYWIRFTVLSMNTSTTLDGSVAVDDPVLLTAVDDDKLRYFAVAKFPFTTRYVEVTGSDDTTTISIQNSGSILGPLVASEKGTIDTQLLNDEPVSIAVVPEFNVFYGTYNYKSLQYSANPAISGVPASLAVVESDPVFVGPDTNYDPSFVPQLGSWPEAKYLLYHRGEMWAANFKGAPQQVRWSAGTSSVTPGYKIWPQISTEFLADTDQGPITGLFSWQDSVLVSKSDSIWQMVYTGLNGQQLNTYRPEKIVSGTGWVSNSSVQDIRGSLVFLAEDGVYRFDGSHVTKLSDRIYQTIDSIAPARRAFAISVNWKSKSLYLLAVTTTGHDINNLILVWDYKNDSWWIWDNIEAVNLFSVEDASDNDHIYFADKAGRIYELGVGLHDYGTPITAYFVTEMLNQDHTAQKARSITVLGSNTTREVDVEIKANDAPFEALDVVTIPFTSAVEKEYGTAQYNADKYTAERQRYGGIGAEVSGEWFRLKLTHDLKDSPGQIREVRIGVQPTGVRQ